MTVETKAAVVWKSGDRFSIENLLVKDPGPGQVMVRMIAAGVCHTDESVRMGRLPYPVPTVLGHEGAGVIEKIGEGVKDLDVGQPVVCVAAPSCGTCYTCLRNQFEICEGRTSLLEGIGFQTPDGKFLPSFTGLGTFSQYMTVPRISVAPVPKNALTFEQLSLLGCAVVTGVGAALNAAKIDFGSTVAVIGCGGIGQSMVQGARIAGASIIIAIDPDLSKREVALSLGATHALDPMAGDLVEKVQNLTDGRGVDFSLEAVGHADTLLNAFRVSRRGGTIVAVGVGGSKEFSILPNELVLSAKKFIGSIYGSGASSRDIPKLAAMGDSGLLNLADMVSRKYPLEQINEAFEAMNSGEVVRAIIELN